MCKWNSENLESLLYKLFDTVAKICPNIVNGTVLSLLAKLFACYWRAFTEDNDPYGEHDFGSIERNDEKYFWKVSYYDQNYEYGSEDPADTTLTRRVLTLMHSSEY